MAQDLKLFERDVPQIFDRALLRRRRGRACRRMPLVPLFEEIAERLLDRLDDVLRDFPVALDLGCRNGEVAKLLGARGRVERLISCDLALAMAQAAAQQDRGPVLVADEERLPFAESSFDLVLSNLALHWANDLPGALVQIRKSLKPDRLFLASLFGGQSLWQLREVLFESEEELFGGVSPRISPFADVPDAGALLQRAGFSLPVVDVDRLSLNFETAFDLMRLLNRSGESNCLNERRRGLQGKALFLRAAEIYGSRHGHPAGGIKVDVEVAYLTAWSPGPNQQRALAPGSGKISLIDVLEPEGKDAGPGETG